jgi:hypothetical protein
VAAVADRVQAERGAVTVRAGREDDVVAADVGTETVGERGEETGAERRAVITGRQQCQDPLRLDGRQDVEVRGEGDDRRCLARVLVADLDLTVLGRQAPARRCREHAVNGHRPIVSRLRSQLFYQDDLYKRSG